MAQKYAKLDSFYRGDTPLFVVPILTGNDLSGWNAYITFNTDPDPLTNVSAAIHKLMTYSIADALNLTGQTGTTYTNYLYYQFTNTDTENLDPNATYYWDVQINRNPVQTNNFTLQTGTFTPYADISRGTT